MGKATMFMFWMWIAVCMAGSIINLRVDFARTHLTADISATDTTINVSDTEGFPNKGIITIGDEHIAYSSTTATTFKGSVAQSLVRGADSTTATTHSSGAQVATIQGSMLNSSVSYEIALIADSSGIQAFVTIPLALLRLLLSFFVLPLSYFGTDLQILSVLWMVLVVGIVVAFGISLAGGRRV